MFNLGALGNMLLAADPIGSAPPANILAAMPPVPQEWTCKASNGVMDLSPVNTPMTTVNRQYLVPPPKQDPPPTAPIPPGVLNITIRDLGDLAKTSGAPHAASQTEQTLTFGPLAGALQQGKNKDWFFSGSIGSRIRVRILGKNFKDDDFKKSLSLLDFSSLAILEKNMPSAPIKTVTSTRVVGKDKVNSVTTIMESSFVDELNPKSNRTWQMGFSHDAK